MAGTFETFFNGWLDRQEAILHQLLDTLSPKNAPDNELLKTLIDQDRLYYEEKANATKHDIFLFFSPPWLSSLERTLPWLGEFKPSMVFKLVNSAVSDLTVEQSDRIEQVKRDTRREERVLTEAMARIQESVASQPIVNFARRFGQPIGGERTRMKEAMESFKTAMLSMMLSADTLRGLTVVNVVEVLSPIQTVEFLVAAAQFQLAVRRWGQGRNARRVSPTNAN